MRAARLIAATAVAIATMAFAATSASAQGFSPNNGQYTTITGTITWKKPGSTPVNCTLTWVRTTLFYGNQSPPFCNGQSMQSNSHMVVGRTDGQGNDSVVINPYSGAGTPTPFPGVSMYAIQTSAPFYDGNASTPSTIVFNDTLVGYGNGGSGNVTWTGTVTMTQTGTGGLVTIP